ncbi:hypothetical protein CVT24_006614 [Panaeolus cyanescens]|uniref:Uncharacterized protein n=1 Tax=Panaeolus cyanescens TaxID=181874 RepID=A0A409YSC1_9AGAR|nr:hypothetical protein CVT24_006614 [Panaeolus cyanescens]
MQGRQYSYRHRRASMRRRSRVLGRRKGGGGSGGRSGGGGGRISGLGSGGRSGTISTGTGPARTATYTSNSAPIPPSAVIVGGQIYAGRAAGGAGRKDIYGTSTYGSGYPGINGRGTAGRGFPFFFWPVIWPIAIGTGAGLTYLNGNGEYGNPSNTTRPGGPMMFATFTSGNDGNPSLTFRLVADNATVQSLVEDISANCSSFLWESATSTSDQASNVPIAVYADSPSTAIPRPESVIQYYRSSSIALSLDGYVNSATYSTNTGAANTPLPKLDIEGQELLVCLNETIGAAAPLVTGVGDASNVASVAGNVIPVVIIILVVLILGTVALKYGC